MDRSLARQETAPADPRGTRLRGVEPLGGGIGHRAEGEDWGPVPMWLAPDGNFLLKLSIGLRKYLNEFQFFLFHAPARKLKLCVSHRSTVGQLLGTAGA